MIATEIAWIMSAVYHKELPVSSNCVKGPIGTEPMTLEQVTTLPWTESKHNAK